MSILNLLLFCLTCYYAIGNKHATNNSQQISACISVAVAFVTFVTIIVYHIKLIIPLNTCINMITRQQKRPLDDTADLEMKTKIVITNDHILTTEVGISPEHRQGQAEEAISDCGNTEKSY